MLSEDRGVIVEFILDISSGFDLILKGVMEMTAFMLNVSKFRILVHNL